MKTTAHHAQFIEDFTDAMNTTTPAPTFCRAAAIAVIKAHGLWREAQAEEGNG